jgi:hypothetical protein
MINLFTGAKLGLYGALASWSLVSFLFTNVPILPRAYKLPSIEKPFFVGACVEAY